jgi:hypothetical protein
MGLFRRNLQRLKSHPFLVLLALAGLALVVWALALSESWAGRGAQFWDGMREAITGRLNADLKASQERERAAQEKVEQAESAIANAQAERDRAKAEANRATASAAEWRARYNRLADEATAIRIERDRMLKERAALARARDTREVYDDLVRRLR